jgi:hypothetical protein
MPLTRLQRQLRAEIAEIAAAVQMDHWNIEKNYEPGELRSVTLELMKDQLVRGHVISCYTLIDELLADIIVDFYFRKGSKTMNYRQLWRTKRFRIFVHYIADETSLLKKLTIVDAIKTVPSGVRKAIERINTVRNALAHSLFPQNRRRYMADKKVMYQSVHLFSLDGVEKFKEDFNIANAYLFKRGFWR